MVTLRCMRKLGDGPGILLALENSKNDKTRVCVCVCVRVRVRARARASRAILRKHLLVNFQDGR